VTSDGPVFVKWKYDAPNGFFQFEADGLNRLRAARALRVPRVLAFQDNDRVTGGTEERRHEETPSFLALEYVETQPPSHAARFTQRFGEELAALHRCLSPFDAFGLENPNYIGLEWQRNTPHADWTTFYRDRRLMPQIERARSRGSLSGERERLLMDVVARLETLLDGLPARPVLLHGDLWSGNFLSAGDEPVVIDPAVYYGDREMEIAYIDLFGGFPHGFLDAYRAAYPLDSGYEFRRPLHQLYHLLNHLNHFGETYGPAVERVCRFYGTA
jgi:fructosamine-3-kinase